MIYAHFKDGVFEGFFDETISRIPEGALPIDDAAHAALLDGLSAGLPVEIVDGVPGLGAGRDSLEIARSRALGEIEQRINAYAGSFSTGLPRETVAAWATKAKAAREELAGTPSALIAAEAEVSGEDRLALATKIAGLADAYELTTVRLDGLRSLVRRLAAAAVDEFELEELTGIADFGTDEAPRALETIIAELVAHDGRSLDPLPDLP